MLNRMVDVVESEKNNLPFVYFFRYFIIVIINFITILNFKIYGEEVILECLHLQK